jgi:quinol monooxygenase YgiN
MLYEKRVSRELWQAHMSAQHLQDYMTATQGAIEECTLNDMAKLV